MTLLLLLWVGSAHSLQMQARPAAHSNRHTGVWRLLHLRILSEESSNLFSHSWPSARRWNVSKMELE